MTWSQAFTMPCNVCRPQWALRQLIDGLYVRTVKMKPRPWYLCGGKGVRWVASPNWFRVVASCVLLVEYLTLWSTLWGSPNTYQCQLRGSWTCKADVSIIPWSTKQERGLIKHSGFFHKSFGPFFFSCYFYCEIHLFGLFVIHSDSFSTQWQENSYNMPRNQFICKVITHIIWF